MFNVKKKNKTNNQNPLLESSLDCYSTKGTPHCAYLYQGIEITNSIIPILALEKLKHNTVLLKILSQLLKNIKTTEKLKVYPIYPIYPSPRYTFTKYTLSTLHLDSKLTLATFALSLISLYIHIYTTHPNTHTFFLNPSYFLLKFSACISKE